MEAPPAFIVKGSFKQRRVPVAVTVGNWMVPSVVVVRAVHVFGAVTTTLYTPVVLAFAAATNALTPVNV